MFTVIDMQWLTLFFLVLFSLAISWQAINRKKYIIENKRRVNKKYKNCLPFKQRISLFNSLYQGGMYDFKHFRLILFHFGLGYGKVNTFIILKKQLNTFHH